MKDYRLYGVHDFLMDEEFIEWVKTGHKQGNIFWEEWLQGNPEKYIVFEEAKRIILAMQIKEIVVSEEEKQAAAQQLLKNIKERDDSLHQNTKNIIPRRKKSFTPLAVAASIAVLAAIGLVYFLQNIGKSAADKFSYQHITAGQKLVEKVNTTSKSQSLTLPDGSIIELQPESKIAYAATLGSGENRDVFLNGDALFKIKRNTAKPFRVFTDEIVTKVLGTSFWVRKTPDSKKITVTVVNGKVSVLSLLKEKENIGAVGSPPGEAILTPNQELLYEKEDQAFKKSLTKNPDMVVKLSDENRLLYNEAAVVDAFAQLQDSYEIKIVYDAESLAACTLTADLRKVPFYEALALICAAIGATYEEIDGQVVINSVGC